MNRLLNQSQVNECSSSVRCYLLKTALDQGEVATKNVSSVSQVTLCLGGSNDSLDTSAYSRERKEIERHVYYCVISIVRTSLMNTAASARFQS